MSLHRCHRTSKYTCIHVFEFHKCCKTISVPFTLNRFVWPFLGAEVMVHSDETVALFRVILVNLCLSPVIIFERNCRAGMFSCTCQHSLTWYCNCLSVGVRNFLKIWQPPQNSKCQKGDLKKVLYWGHVHWCTYLYFRKTSIIIILNHVLGTTIQNLVAWVTRHVGFAYVCS
jgi:hypothetical protein